MTERTVEDVIADFDREAVAGLTKPFAGGAVAILVAEIRSLRTRLAAQAEVIEAARHLKAGVFMSPSDDLCRRLGRLGGAFAVLDALPGGSDEQR